ncbi:hypothetical protein [Dokdonia sp.]|uniref:hypothetical protein n=1 Tax=Dokdonia sp. TaxID=2024995 RepID=UPI003265E9E1
MEIVNIVIGGLVIAIIIILFRLLIPPEEYKKKKQLLKQRQKIEEEKEKKRMADPRIYDPKTDTYITLEQAESGIWDVYDPKNKISAEDVKATFSESDYIDYTIRKEFVKEGFKRVEGPFSEEQYEQIEKFELLKQLEYWSYDDHFKQDEITAILLSTHGDTLISTWIPVTNISGHYVFKEKTKTERFFDAIQSDDDIKVENYECFTIQKTKTTRSIENMMQLVNKHKHIEVEIMPGHLFIKTTRPARLTDLFMVLNLTRDIM